MELYPYLDGIIMTTLPLKNPDKVLSVCIKDTKRRFGKAIGSNSRVNRLRNYVVLHAENYPGQEWCFRDGPDAVPVRDFVREWDGKCAAIVLDVTPPAQGRIYSLASAVIHPYDCTSRRVGEPRLYMPDYGYVDDKQSLERIAASLRGAPKRRPLVPACSHI